FLLVLTFFTAIFSFQTVGAQGTDSLPKLKTYHVGIFAPLYLDSVFSAAGNFRYSQGMPKFISPAVDFVNGVQLGLDSLKLTDVNIEAYIYDTKSYKEPLSALVKNKKLDNLDLLIGPVRDFEYKQLADFALAKNIPFISAAYPNDGGVTANPFVVILNSTLKAHCEAIYSFLLQDHGTDKIFLCRKKGQQEDRVASYFKAINEQDGKPLLNIQTLNFDSTLSSDILQKKLDSNRNSIIIGASLEEGFAARLAHACDDLDEEYPITLIGMPNWDGFKSLTKKGDFEGFPIYFTTPYHNYKTDMYSKMLMNGYSQKLKGKPSDMAFKGFECVQLFVNLLIKYPNDFMSHINDKSFRIYSDYNFKPVMLKKDSIMPDYFENKHLNFVKIYNGNMTKAW
ncbi:MAG: ABC transporter substrate-binding protein, partial [Bacteroidota bacterium]